MAPHVRHVTTSNVPFEVMECEQTAADNQHGLANRQWFMRNTTTGQLMSPWHDLEIESTTSEANHITGIIEITRGTHSKLECIKEIAFNPIMQDVTKSKEGVYRLRDYVKPPKFNYGFVP